MNHRLLAVTPYALYLAAQDFFISLLPYFAVMVVLILADLRFGIRAARIRKERIKFSTAGRRTINKFLDYTTWICLAVIFDHVITTPLSIPCFRFACLLLVFGLEMESCFTNFLESRGLKLKISLLPFIRRQTKHIFQITKTNQHENK